MWVNRLTLCLGAPRQARPAAINPSTLFTPGTLGGLWETAVAGSLWQDTAATVAAAAAADPVGRVNDLSGNGNHLLQATANRRPVRRLDAGVTGLEFDGVDDQIRAVFTLPQPATRISLLRQKSWTSSDRLLDGGANNVACLLQNGGAPNLGLSVSVTSNTVFSGESLEVWQIVTEIFDGANTRGAINAEGFGSHPTAGGVAVAGLTVGGHGGGLTTSAGHLDWAGTLLIGRVLNDQEIAGVRSWFAARAAVAL